MKHVHVNVHRKLLSKAEDFQEYLALIGKPKFAITCECEKNCEFLKKDEWVFSNDIEALMQEVFDWNKKGIKLVYIKPDEEFDGEWAVDGLPDYFNDAASLISARFGYGPSDYEKARKAFLGEIFRQESCYGFFTLDENSYDRYLEDWLIDDNKAKTRESEK